VRRRLGRVLKTEYGELIYSPGFLSEKVFFLSSRIREGIIRGCYEGRIKLLSSSPKMMMMR
jgi:hypothetical protein